MTLAPLLAAAVLATTSPDPAVGHYVYRDAELDASVDLRSDGTFDYRVDGIGKPVEGEKPLHYVWQGVWRAGRGDRLQLTNAPTAPPRFVQTSATRDPSVRAAFTITVPEGTEPGGLVLDIDDNADGATYGLSEPTWTLPLFIDRASYDLKGVVRTPTARPHKLAIRRDGDGLLLATVALTPTGPNRFAFAYTPSPVEPFHLQARRVPEGVEVELGQAGLTLHRAP